MSRSLWIHALVWLLVAAAGVHAKYIVPGGRWYDTDGNRISAHGGCVVVEQETGKFWWFGEYKVEDESQSKGISAYSSDDLASWTYHGLALSPIDGHAYISPNNTMQHPKVVYSKSANEYRMWWHADNSSGTMLLQGVATSPNISGPYTFASATAPAAGNWSEDLGLFTDSRSNKSYALYNTGPSDGKVRVDELDADLTALAGSSSTAVFNFDLGSPSMVQTDTSYWAIMSHKTDYRPNNAVAFRADNVSGDYSQPFMIAPLGTRTFNSQASHTLKIAGTARTTYLYLGDRWVANELWESTYVWLPMNIDEDKKTLSLEWHDVFDLDVTTGEVSAVEGTTYYAKDGAFSGSVKTKEASYLDSGAIAIGINGNTSTVTIAGVEGTGEPQWVAFYYENMDDSGFGDQVGGAPNRKGGDDWRVKRIASVVVNGDGGGEQALYELDTHKAMVLSAPLLLTLNKGSNNSIEVGGRWNGVANEGASLDRIVVYPSESSADRTG